MAITGANPARKEVRRQKRLKVLLMEYLSPCFVFEKNKGERERFKRSEKRRPKQRRV
ncbi:MAG: hypothetical protein DDT31_00419 [Syntrophomonadaceae bacterium]|nr:hypothetical protein [Bacillota bacterium]